MSRGNFGSGWYAASATSCSLRSARILSGITLFFFRVGSSFVVVENSVWSVSAVAIVGDAMLILARRVDTWVDPYDERVGFVVLDCAFALAVSCCLRQPRIASGATRFGRVLRVCTCTT
ncbi:hypothetical protein [Gimesia sp.]|uniref:hypothetical protein n=1 Tax=Gimesia sp. TaxID=2024833 RepID=UPI0025BD4969|nr:hypothetical protein [Gimesia sp.]